MGPRATSKRAPPLPSFPPSSAPGRLPAHCDGRVAAGDRHPTVCPEDPPRTFFSFFLSLPIHVGDELEALDSAARTESRRVQAVTRSGAADPPPSPFFFLFFPLDGERVALPGERGLSRPRRVARSG